MNEKECQYDRIFEKTIGFGRPQLVREIQMQINDNKKKDKEIERLNNIIKNLDKMFEYYFLGNLKYDQDTVNTIYIKYVELKELLKEGEEWIKKV